MDIKAFPALIVGVVVALVLAGAVLPVFAETSSAETTFKNDGYFRMTQYDNTTDHTITWTYEKPAIVTVDNEDVTINYHVKSGQITVIANSIWLVRMLFDSNGDVSGLAFLYGASGTKLVNVSDNATASVTLTSGSASVVFGTYTGTHSYDIVYLPDNEGDYTMCDPNKTNYLNADSHVYGFGLTRIRNNSGTVGSPGVGFAFSGDIENGITGSVWRGGDSTVVNDCEIITTENTAYTDLYTFDKITAVATLTETVDSETVTTDTDLVYNMVIVPYSVTSEKTVHPDGPLTVLLNVLPLLAIAGLVTGAVVWFINRKG